MFRLVDAVYGKEVLIQDQTYWPRKDRDVIVGVNIPTADFVEHVMVKFLKESSMMHIKQFVDLSFLSDSL